MSRRIPPLNALRALEAAGRHESFTQAAAELCVTPGAISHQITQLEEHLGMPLFERVGNTLSLTEKGRDYVNALSYSFDRVDLATKRLLNPDHDHQIHISCTMAIFLRWLMPHLLSFHLEYPKRDVRITTTAPVPALLSPSDIDVAIRLDATPPNLVGYKLFDNELIMVCSPSLLKEGPPLKDIDDLERHTFLHSRLGLHHWVQWLNGATTHSIVAKSNVYVDSFAELVLATFEGRGCAIMKISLVLEDILNGKLVSPFPLAVVASDSHWLVYERDNTAPKVIEFRDWILAEAATFNERIMRHTTQFRRIRDAM
jgi:LysR family glycine cleavage system transcriptional activator